MVQYAGNRKPAGGVIDWDSVTLDTEKSHPAPVFCTRSQPLLAIDVLSDKPWGHLYRYDLEFLVYILVWAAVHYNLKTKTRSPWVHRSLVDWVIGSLDSRVIAKQSFVMVKNGLARENIYDAVSDDFEPIMDSVVDPLLDLLADGYADRPRKKAPVADYDYVTYGDHITFNRFMETIHKNRVGST